MAPKPKQLTELGHVEKKGSKWRAKVKIAGKNYFAPSRDSFEEADEDLRAVRGAASRDDVPGVIAALHEYAANASSIPPQGMRAPGQSSASSSSSTAPSAKRSRVELSSPGLCPQQVPSDGDVNAATTPGLCLPAASRAHQSEGKRDGAQEAPIQQQRERVSREDLQSLHEAALRQAPERERLLVQQLGSLGRYPRQKKGDKNEEELEEEKLANQLRKGKSKFCEATQSYLKALQAVKDLQVVRGADAVTTSGLCPQQVASGGDADSATPPGLCPSAARPAQQSELPPLLKRPADLGQRMARASKAAKRDGAQEAPVQRRRDRVSREELQSLHETATQQAPKEERSLLQQLASLGRYPRQKKGEKTDAELE